MLRTAYVLVLYYAKKLPYDKEQQMECTEVYKQLAAPETCIQIKLCQD